MLSLGIRTPQRKHTRPILRPSELDSCTTGMLIAPTSFRAHNRVQHNAHETNFTDNTTLWAQAAHRVSPEIFTAKRRYTKAKHHATTAGRIDVAQLAIHCSPALTTPLAILSGRHTQTREPQPSRRLRDRRLRSREARELRQNSLPLA